MDKSSLTFKTLRNASYNLVGYILPMAFALFITPIVVLKLGIKEYGIYIFVTSVIGVLGLLDLGLGSATTKLISHAHGKNDREGILRIVSSSNLLFFLTGLLGVIASVAITLFGPSLLPQQFAQYQSYAHLFFIGGLIFFSNTVTLSYSALITALQRYDLSVKIGTASFMLISLSMLLFALTGQSLTVIFLSQLAIAIATSAANYIVARKLNTDVSYGLRLDFSVLKRSFSFGLMMALNNLALSASTSFTRIFIPIFAGPSGLTYFSMASTISSKIPGLSNSLGTSLFPTASELEGQNSGERLSILYVRSVRLISMLAAALSVTALAFSSEALRYWLDETFALNAAGALAILSVSAFVMAVYGPTTNFLLGAGKIKVVTAASVAMAVLNIGLIFLLMPKYGIIGAAWAQLISLVPTIAVFYLTETRFLSLRNRKSHHLRQAAGILSISLIVLAVDRLILARFIGDLPTLLVIGSVSCALFAFLYKVFGFLEEEDWKDLTRFASLVVRRLKKGLDE